MSRTFERPFKVIYEDIHGRRWPLSRIVLDDHLFEFILEAPRNVILRQMS